MMSQQQILSVVQAHTRYDVKCECGEYLLKRAKGFMSSRDQWEEHLAEVLTQALIDADRQANRVHQDKT